MSLWRRLSLPVLFFMVVSRTGMAWGAAVPPEGTIQGTVRDRATQAPLPGVNVTIRDAAASAGTVGGDSGAIVAGTFTDVSGLYILTPVTPGRYLATFSSVGYRKLAGTPVDVTDGVVMLDVALEEVPLNMDAVVVSASRREEKAVAAPGSTSVVDAATIAARPGVTPVDHLRATGGVDIAQTGLMQQTVVTRGFNNVFSTTLTMLTDNRIASVPSLRANIPAFIPVVDDDLERIEVVRGPASALYGPNAHNGVVNFITRSPFASRGTTLSLAGGTRSLVQGAVRHAGTAGSRFGYKISGQYFRGRDWEYDDPEEVRLRGEALASGASPETLRIGRREDFVERFGGEARADVLLGEDASANLTVGVNQTVRTIELTDIGASQGRNWRYAYIQSRLTAGPFFVQAFLNASDAGDSFILRTGQPVVDRSRMFVAQAQYRPDVGERLRLTGGADVHLTRPVTDGTITGRNEERDGIDEAGVYLQAEARVIPGTLDLVAAARADHNNRLEDIVFSPRAALVYTGGAHTLRLSYNRAYSTPNTTELFLDILAEENFLPPPVPDQYNYDIRGSGIPEGGYLFARDASGSPFMHSPLAADPGTAIPVDDAASLWPALVQALQQFGFDLTGVPAPSSADVGAHLARFDAASESFVPVSGVADIPALGPTITRTVEGGYRAAIGEVLLAGADVYHTTVSNFIGQFQVITPNVFMNGADVADWLEANGYSQPEAALYGAIIGGLPLGTVTPDGVIDPTALLVTPRNFGEVSLWGADLSVECAPHPAWRLLGTLSVLSRNFFENLDGEGDLSLNAPEQRAMVSAGYRDPAGRFRAAARARWMSGFRMLSGVYAGDVRPCALVDLDAGAPVPWVPGTTLTVSALNLFDTKHREFIGAPEIGRLVVGRLHYVL